MYFSALTAIALLNRILGLDGRSVRNDEEDYDLTSLSAYNLQFCAIVENGRGYCSIFLEMRGEPWRRNIETSSGRVSEVYLGSCLCDELRSKSFCSKSLEAARPEDCFFGDPNRGDYNYTRVHRRLCDLSIMGKYPLCSCKQTMDSRPFRRVRGFPTCYQWPIENWLCERHSVCGVAACSTSTLPSGLVSVQCHNKCIHNQPFCESKPINGSSSSPRVVTSVWSDWACLKPTSMNFNDEDSTGEVVQICQSTCQDPKSGKPAFDCLGRGNNCCPGNTDECNYQVVTTSHEMKLIGYIFLQKNFNPDNTDKFIYS